MRLLAALLVCVIALSGSVPQVRATSQALPQDAYIWQRAWTPALLAAARESSDLVRSWRILLAESDGAGRWSAVSVRWADILATHRPITGVIRIDGRLDEARIAGLLDRIVSQIDGVGADLAGVEIDYDCPTSKLAGYARFLGGLRARLPRRLALSITALPTWMNASDLTSLVRDLDEIVLQVHAVDDPRRGLFDADRAEQWVQTFGRRIQRPFRVAVPAYDVRVTWRPDGRLASVEGETPLLAGPSGGQVLAAEPEAVLHFLQAMERSGPANLAGIVWFRLPTDADTRAWSLSTWRAVMTGNLPPASVSARLVATDQAGAWTVSVANDGPVDAMLPRRVELAPDCEMADGANGFRLAVARDRAGPLVLEASRAGERLRAHRTRVIGWARCPQPGQELHVVP